MMKGRKKIFVLLSLVSVMLIAAACTQTNHEEKKESIQESAEEKWVWERKIEIICPYSAGSGNDQAARALATSLGEVLDVPVTVTNVSGGNSAVGFEYYLELPADGYSFFECSPAIIIRSLDGDISRDINEFLPIGVISSGLYCVHGAKGKFANIDELVAYAKENPGTLRIGGVGNKSVDFIATRQFADTFGIELSFISFDSDSEITTALMTGDLDLAVASPGDVAEYLEAGTTVGYVVFGSERNQAIPDIPSMADIGYDSDFMTCRYLLCNPETPAEAVEAMREAMKLAANTDSYKDYLTAIGNFSEAEGYKDAEFLQEYMQFMSNYMIETGMCE